MTFYCGELDYQDGSGECITVNRLIARDGEIACDISTTWGKHEEWKYSLVASRCDSDKFIAHGIFGLRIRGGSAVSDDAPSTITFNPISFGETNITISGEWAYRGKSYPFSGTLDQGAARAPNV